MVVHIESRDGTTIGFRRLGQGPGLVVVHGSIATGDEWSRVASALADRFTVHLVDRRGRGLSGDADAYSIDTEIADIAAVLDAAGPDASLVGHSYGALCALAAVASGVDVPGLVLYEPPVPVAGPLAGAALEPYAAAVAAGDLDRALTIAMIDILRVPAAGVDRLRGTPIWSRMAELAPTWVRELRVIDGHGPDVSTYASVTTPTLFLQGSRTAQHHVVATEALRAVMPDTRLVEFAGHEHFAHVTTPTAVADAIAEFLTAVR